jgi:hypothetical protein
MNRNSMSRGRRPDYDDIEDRLRECFEYGLSQLPS